MRLSFDTAALAVLAVVWATIAFCFLWIVDMTPGARGWGAGATVFVALTAAVWYAERRGRRRHADQPTEGASE